LILFIPSIIFKTNRKYTTSIIGENTILPTPKEFLQAGTTFLLVTIGWIFFRSETLMDSFNYILRMNWDFNSIYLNKIPFIFFLIFFEWQFRFCERKIYIKSVYRVLYDLIFIFLIIAFAGNNKTFIYFNF
jgi:hypothetical protein